MSLQAALDIAALCGWAVFPVAADCATPMVGKGCHAASKDPNEIRAMFGGRQDANFAIATGLVSGVFVLDVDVGTQDGAATLRDLIRKYGPLPVVPKALTPSPGSCQLYFTQPDRPIRNRVCFLPGLDVRATGGSAVQPPSKRRGRANKVDGEYRWERGPWDCPPDVAPPWLIELIDPPPPPRPPIQPLRFNTTDRAARFGAAAVNDECGQLAAMKAGTGRNLRLYQASANLFELVAAGVLNHDRTESCLLAAAHDCGLVADDGMHAVRATIASGMRKGLANPREIAS